MFHIAFKKNGRVAKRMGDYPTQNAAIADARAMQDAGTVPRGIAVQVCNGSCAGTSTPKTNPRKAKSSGAGAVRCVSDRYDADGSVPYSSVADFRGMCRASFGKAPTLTKHADGWHDAHGLVLVPARRNPARKATKRNPSQRKFVASGQFDTITVDVLDGRYSGEHTDTRTGKLLAKKSTDDRPTIVAWVHTRMANLDALSRPPVKQDDIGVVLRRRNPARKPAARKHAHARPAEPTWYDEGEDVRNNPSLFGHDVAKTSKGYTVTAYNKSFATKAGVRSFLTKHVAAERKKR